MPAHFNYLNFPKIPDEFIRLIITQKEEAYKERYADTNAKEVSGSRVAHVPLVVENWIIENIFPIIKPSNPLNLIVKDRPIFEHIMIHVSEYIEYTDEHSGWTYTNAKGIVPIHKDWSRWYPVNYVVDQCGSNVKTNFYDDDHNYLEGHVIEPFRWHIIAGKTFHGVEGIEPGCERILISINWDPDNYETFDISRDLEKYIEN